MASPESIGLRAHASRLAVPAQTLLEISELVVEQFRGAGPAEAMGDLEKVLAAARDLHSRVGALLERTGPLVVDPGTEAVLRHDLRTPINAILGYSELLEEELSASLPDRLAADLRAIRTLARQLLLQIDHIVEHARQDTDETPIDPLDATMAARLARTIDPGPVPSGTEPGRILVVDDLSSNRELLARRLRMDGHAVVEASSAAAALDLLARSSFDLLIFDVLMPGMNGIELLRRVKADPILQKTPVLMISGLKQEEAVLRCIAEGAEDYLPRPVDPVLLRARIQACLERARWRDQERRYVERINMERDRANALLEAVLPTTIVHRLNTGEQLIADRFDSATIIFADIVDFSPLAARTNPSMLLTTLDKLFSRFDQLAETYGIEKIKTIGDAYMAASGIPEEHPEHAVAAVDFARAILADVGHPEVAKYGFHIRVGVHSGPVVAGLIGRKRFVYDVWGHTVNVASRMESSSMPGRIQISQNTLDNLGGRYQVERRGSVDLKGIGLTETYFICE